MIGTTASVVDPETWDTYTDAISAARRFGLNGVGFVLTAFDPYVVIDLDGYRDPVSGALSGDDLERVASKRSAARLGFALLLKFFAAHGRFPADAVSCRLRWWSSWPGNCRVPVSRMWRWLRPRDTSGHDGPRDEEGEPP